MSVDKQRFEAILQAARTRSSSNDADTMVVAAHLAQMRLFMIRQGVEFFARQDTFAQRREFLRRVVDFNELPGKLEAIIDSFLIDGRGLLYFRPSKDLYRLHYFTPEQYRCYYDEEGGLEEIQIIYSFRVKPSRGFGGGIGIGPTYGQTQHMGGNPSDSTRWVRIRVRADVVEQTVSNEQPNFDNELIVGRDVQTLTNSLGFIPAVEVFNNRGLDSGVGRGEFDGLASYILQHDKMVKNIKSNLGFFGNPTLVSSRPKHDLVEPDSDNANAGRATISSNSGFVGLNRASSRLMDPGTSLMLGGGVRVPRVIANVEAADRVGYIVPDAVSGDLTAYAAQYQEMIRAALGGVDDLSISSGATAFEVRTLYGRVAATAKKKCRELFEYGFCKLFSLMILQEETLFRESLAQALDLPKPEPLLLEDLPPEQHEAAKQKYDKLMATWREAVNVGIQSVKETGEVPPGVVGLIPDGDGRVDWRWMGEVFEDSPQELLQKSIVCRNLQELGVGSIEALQHLFPEKTPEERAAMLSGYPFRMVEATQRSVGVFMDILRGMFQVPHPQEPDLPMAADPNLDLVPYIYRSLDFLRRELSYSGTYADVDPANIPTILSDPDRYRAQLGRATELERERERLRTGPYRLGGNSGAPAGDPANGAPGQLGYGSGSMAGGLQSTRRISDANVPTPGMGGTLAWDPAQPEYGPGSQLGSGFGAGIDASGIPGGLGAPDLLAPTNAGLQPFGGPGGAAGPGDEPAAGRGPAKRRPARKRR